MTTKFFDLGESQISRDLAPCQTQRKWEGRASQKRSGEREMN